MTLISWRRRSTPSDHNDHRHAWDPKSRRQRLRDIIERGTSVKTILEGASLNEFLSDTIRQKAACYDVLCIAQAVTRLLEIDPGLTDRSGHVPWRQVANIGNVLRHEYGRVDMTIIWDTVVRGRLEALLKAVAAELERSD